MPVTKIEKNKVKISQRQTNKATGLHAVTSRFVTVACYIHLSAVSFSCSHNPIFGHSSSSCDTEKQENIITAINSMEVKI